MMDQDQTKQGTFLYFLLGMATGAGAVLLLTLGLDRQRETRQLAESEVARVRERKNTRRRPRFGVETVAALPGEEDIGISEYNELPGYDEIDVPGEALPGEEDPDGR